MVVEVMGRHAGWIALHAGLAGGANLILIPERPFDIAEVCERLQRRHDNGENSSIVVIAEGAVPQEGTMTLQSGDVDAFGHVQLGGVGSRLADEIQQRTGYDARVTILGHVLRGGTPTAFDRILSTRFGVAAVDAVHDGAFGTMVALQAGEIARVPIAEAVGTLKTVEPDLYDLAAVFLG
jgi:6-phosphofructokinase 1